MNRKDVKDKLDIERAIEFQENKFLTVSQCLYSEEAKLNNHNVTLAIKALQEQLDRLEGCEVCVDRSDKLLCEFELVKNSPKYKAGYCPNCGRKLKEV